MATEGDFSSIPTQCQFAELFSGLNGNREAHIDLLCAGNLQRLSEETKNDEPHDPVVARKSDVLNG